MLEAAGVLFEVGALDGDGALLVGDRDGEFAVLAQRGVVLRDLKVLREVGVVVVLSVESRLLGHVGVDGGGEFERPLDGGLVEHRERAGQAETRRTGVRIRLAVLEIRATAAEDLRTGFELDVDFEADHDAVFVRLDGLSGHWKPVRPNALKRTGTPDRSASNCQIRRTCLTHVYNHRLSPDTMSGNRVEKLESRVEELEASVSGLTEELMQTKAQLADLEAETEAEGGYIEAGVGSVTQGKSESGSNGSAGSNGSSETSEEANPTEHETEDTEPPEADDIIVA